RGGHHCTVVRQILALSERREAHAKQFTARDAESAGRSYRLIADFSVRGRSLWNVYLHHIIGRATPVFRRHQPRALNFWNWIGCVRIAVRQGDRRPLTSVDCQYVGPWRGLDAAL